MSDQDLYYGDCPPWQKPVRDESWNEGDASTNDTKEGPGKDEAK